MASGTLKESMATQLPDIFQYLDYRQFLRDCYAALKGGQRGFSYRAFSRKAGMSSPNFLKLVIDGKRNLTGKSCEQFITALALPSREAEFFRELVGFNQADNAATKNEHFKALGRFRKHKRVHKLDRDLFTYLSQWYYPAIRELVLCDGFQEDPEWIAAHVHPPIPAAQASQALDVLLELGLLVRDEEGTLTHGETLVSTGPEVHSLGIGNFHRQMMERAAASIETVDREHREISGVTVALSAEGFALFKQRIHELRSELLELSASETAPKRVVQFNFQAFPLAIAEDEEP